MHIFKIIVRPKEITKCSHPIMGFEPLSYKDRWSILYWYLTLYCSSKSSPNINMRCLYLAVILFNDIYSTQNLQAPSFFLLIQSEEKN